MAKGQYCDKCTICLVYLCHCLGGKEVESGVFCTLKTAQDRTRTMHAAVSGSMEGHGQVLVSVNIGSCRGDLYISFWLAGHTLSTA